MPNERSFMDVLKYIHPSCCTDLRALRGWIGDGLGMDCPKKRSNLWTSNGDSGNKTTNPIRRGSPMVKASDSHPKVPGSNPGGDLFYLINSLAIKQFAKFQL